MKIRRDIGTEILQSIQEIKTRKGNVQKIETKDDIVNIRKYLQLSQVDFAVLMGINVRTLQEWEQGRRKPRGAAISLLKIASKHPQIFIN
ncbi:MAG: type II toxin-antitoxin system MqsA family antitoxin [Rickettsia endosymbiont of Labidopullus appendiculatus]|nr:type II toxin-antitoxin system MqsA family antitoxin [Rickettsia endosymbiont of Labidopullus appendiculatus]